MTPSRLPPEPTDTPPARSIFSSLTSTLQRTAINFLRLTGPIPKHIGFIMDGNRRYAKKMGVETGVGHFVGSRKLEETLEWCLHLGIQTITLYAFSIENFKRPASEVSTLMSLATTKLHQFTENTHFITTNQIRIRILGNTSLLPPDVRAAAHQAQISTQHHRGPTVNICCPYTSRYEMAKAVSMAVRGVEEGFLEVGDLDEGVLDRLMGTGDDPELDLLVRTSGESRLSDFLLWQISKPSQTHFLSVLWPEFTFWHMLPILFTYQSHYSRILAEREALSRRLEEERGDDVGRRERVEKFLAFLREERERGGGI